jgi:hypothetical protein
VTIEPAKAAYSRPPLNPSRKTFGLVEKSGSSKPSTALSQPGAIRMSSRPEKKIRFIVFEKIVIIIVASI